MTAAIPACNSEPLGEESLSKPVEILHPKSTVGFRMTREKIIASF